MSDMRYKNGEEVKRGDVIRWKCYDNDDSTTWTFTGLVKGDGVVYLGSGIDFGMSIGKNIPYKDVVRQSEDNDGYDVGIEKVGTALDLARHIAIFNKHPI